MRIIGDIHGQWADYLVIRQGSQSSIQVGDTGIFRPKDIARIPEDPNHRFFRGNHDNPEIYRQHPNALSDFGFDNGIFWYAGAKSIDRQFRTLGIDYWDNEELTNDDFVNASAMYGDIKPDIVLSHDCPAFLYKNLGIYEDAPSYTARALHELLKIHMPSIWIFGHHHRKFKMYFKRKTKFIGLNALIPNLNVNLEEVYVDI